MVQRSALLGLWNKIGEVSSPRRPILIGTALVGHPRIPPQEISLHTIIPLQSFSVLVDTRQKKGPIMNSAQQNVEFTAILPGPDALAKQNNYIRDWVQKKCGGT